MKVSYNWLKEYIDLKGVTAKKVADLLTLHSFEVESLVKKDNDWILDVDILPNRAHDARCHLAVALELAAILGKKPEANYQSLKTAPLRLSRAKLEPVEVKIDCQPASLPRYAGLVIKDVKVGLSPQWLQDRLVAVGLRPINNLVDLTNYIMYEVGQPMHAFDYDKIKQLSKTNKPQMRVRLSKKGEKVITLDGVERELDKDILVIEAGGKLIDLAGIMGGGLSEIGPKTKNIVLQAACFDGATVRRATKILNHKTDASDIYQNNIDPNLADLGLGRAWYLLKDIAGGQIVQKIDIYPVERKTKEIKLDLGKVRSLLGVNLSVKKIVEILKSLDFEIRRDVINRVSTKIFTVTAPTRRLDINIPEDLIEEIGRIYGYQKIKPVMPRVHLQPEEPNQAVIYKHQMRQILVNLGFDEVINYIFTHLPLGARPRILVRGRQGAFLQRRLVAIQNPISREKTHLRASLLPGLVQNLKDNLRNFSEIQLFEIGHVFHYHSERRPPHPSAKAAAKNLASNRKSSRSFAWLRSVQDDVVVETENLAGLILLPEKEIFYRLKGIMDTFLEHLGISDVWYDDAIAKTELVGVPALAGDRTVFNKSALAQIKVGENLIGYVGEIKEKFASQAAAGFELDLTSLIREVTEERMYQPPSKYPASVRDLAVLVPARTKVAEVLNIIHSAKIPELVDIDLFDMYQGEQTGARKNLAFHLVFQSSDHTLSDREIGKFMSRIMQAVSKQKAWQIRH